MIEKFLGENLDGLLQVHTPQTTENNMEVPVERGRGTKKLRRCQDNWFRRDGRVDRIERGNFGEIKQMSTMAFKQEIKSLFEPEVIT